MKAFAYLRTSSATNVGKDKDSDKRQREAISSYAAANDIEIVAEYYDANVKGADPVYDRPGFSEMLGVISGNGVRMILVESASRFARDLMVQEAGVGYLNKLGITVVPVDDPGHFNEDTPTQKLVRQILGAVAEFEKAMVVAKLRGARERKRAVTGRCEGRKQAPVEHRTLANRLRGDGLSLREIASRLAVAGYHAPSGNIYGPASISAMIEKA